MSIFLHIPAPPSDGADRDLGVYRGAPDLRCDIAGRPHRVADVWPVLKIYLVAAGLPPRKGKPVVIGGIEM